MKSVPCVTQSYIRSDTLSYYILTETSPAFNDVMGKIESSSGINSSWVVFVWCPMTCLLSILARILFNRVEPWSIVQGRLDRSCCSCWPPRLKSTYKDVEMEIEEPRVAENPTAEYREIIEVIADNRQQNV